MDLSELTDDIITDRPVTPEEAFAVLRLLDAETLALMVATGRVRHHHFGTTMKVNYLINLKSGLCPEDCFYCSQRLGSQADVLEYRWLKNEDAVTTAKAGTTGGAKWVHLVASGRGLSSRDVNKATEIVGEIKAEHPDVETYACLGQLRGGQPEWLAVTGTDTYSHNLNTAESHYDSVCTTHSYQGRTETVQRAREHGLSACSDLITDIGESDEQLVEVASALREIGTDSIPMNFLIPFDGTPLTGRADLSPQRYLRILAMIWFVHPDNEVRVTANREQHLRNLQPLSLEICNSLFLGDYFTSEGRAGAKDLTTVADYGFTIPGQEKTSPEVDVRPVVRNRGAETPEPVNTWGHFRGRV